ncbi:FHA domain-containing protein [Tannerella forsythia]|uniref:FHA domain-containing protein n=1 Tax=Tannerella forsythia TaxID=28112 RepID=A0A3P1XHT5_TANFO|nr:FHA domain-containing protein [Tannerella forsythia]RRD58352.1 FHA domain-containing protein [Tannerella forsythia]
MNKTTIRLGRAPENDKVFAQGDVSGKHALITMIGENEYKVEDLDSANGTYVNGYRIKKAVISNRDELRLSANVIVDFPALFGKTKKHELPPNPKTNLKDYVKEFQELKSLYVKYKDDRKRILRRNNQKMAILRGAITFSPMLALMLTGGNTHLMGVMILGSTLAGVLTSGVSIQDKLDELDENFRIRYVCPNRKCGQQLNGQPWAVIHATGFCPKCGAIYNMNKL